MRIWAQNENIFSGVSATKTPKLPSNQLNYYNWSRDHLKKLHQDLKLTKEEVKNVDKFQYDVRHRANEPQWAVGESCCLTKGLNLIQITF